MNQLEDLPDKMVGKYQVENENSRSKMEGIRSSIDNYMSRKAPKRNINKMLIINKYPTAKDRTP
jgi:hypothetical protein